mgnify:CR=1 FL=1
MKDSRKSTATFTYHNENPKGWKSSGDCVIRAIAFATGHTWEDVYWDLCTLGRKLHRMPNDDKVYETYLKNLGIEKMSQPRKSTNKKFTIQEFAKASRGTHIIRTAGHLTVVKCGKIYDTWNCGDYCVGNYWTIH